MLGFYLKTIVIWMIIMYCTITFFKKPLYEKLANRITEKTTLLKALGYLFMMSAIPIIRLLIELSIIYIAVCNQEDFDRMIEEHNKKDNN